MKGTLLFCFLLPVMALCAGEVVFVPGWNTESVSTERYARALQKIYPDDKITVLKWKSNAKWFPNAVKNADAFVPDAVKFIADKSAEERAELILIGHSLGGRIAVNAASELVGRKMTVKQIILLGAAIDCDVDLNPVVAASRSNCINVFSYNDSVLKFGYANFQPEHKFPLGLSGAMVPPGERFVEYRMESSDADGQSDGGLTRTAEDIFVHDAREYLDELRKITLGECVPYRPKYDYSKVEESIRKPTIPKGWSIPPFGKMETLDSYAGWRLVKATVEIRKKDRSVYFILDHYGRLRLWNLLLRPLKHRFGEIKELIVEKQ